jgi:hypothetical protein
MCGGGTKGNRLTFCIRDENDGLRVCGASQGSDGELDVLWGEAAELRKRLLQTSKISLAGDHELGSALKFQH